MSQSQEQAGFMGLEGGTDRVDRRSDGSGRLRGFLESRGSDRVDLRAEAVRVGIIFRLPPQNCILQFIFPQLSTTSRGIEDLTGVSGPKIENIPFLHIYDIHFC